MDKAKLEEYLRTEMAKTFTYLPKAKGRNKYYAIGEYFTLERVLEKVKKLHKI